MTRSSPSASSSSSELFQRPSDARALLLLAHGAGAGPHHAFMEALTERLVAHRLAVLRYAFAYMEQGRRRPDPAPVLQAAVESAAERARNLAAELPLFAGGKSMGGRMTSLALAEGRADSALSKARGLFFVGFPLHPAGRPATRRGEHLGATRLPLLFLQGTRDKLADLELLRPLLAPLGERCTLHVVEGADHGFHVLKRSGRDDDEVLDELADALASWVDHVLAA